MLTRPHIRCSLLIVLCLNAARARADEAWNTYAVKEGISLEKRPVAGSKYYEYRAVTTMQVPPRAVLAALWAGVLDPPATVRKRTVLRRTDDEMLVYDQIKTPVVSDRDVTIDIRRSVLPDGAIEVNFENHNELGPPLDPKYVRLPTVRGGWRAEPAGAGASKIVYHCYSEPGGSLPAFLVRGAQQDQVLIDVKRIIDRLRAQTGAPAK